MSLSNNKIKIIILAGKSQSTPIVFNALTDICEVSCVILENPPSKIKFIKSRIRKLGVIQVLGQLLFQVTVYKLLKKTSKKRVLQLFKEFKLDNHPIPQNTITNVVSINSPISIKIINELKPDLIIVNGTRIISKQVIESIKAPLINTHMGITPKYRGVHGGYWALANNDMLNFGVTVHAVDSGIDTGKIIGQKFCAPNEYDNFTTYPLLQLASGIEILKELINNFTKNREITFIEPKVVESCLWYHPTAWIYLYRRFTRGIK